MNPAAHQRIEELLNRGELPLGKISLDLAEALRRGDITTGSGVLHRLVGAATLGHWADEAPGWRSPHSYPTHTRGDETLPLGELKSA